MANVFDDGGTRSGLEARTARDGSAPAARCYLCDEAIVAGNVSDEHVIPNALGGTLRSRELLCRLCNAKLGHEVDVDLCNCAAPLGILIGLKRDSGHGRAVPIMRADGSRLLLDHDGRLRTQQPERREEPYNGGVRITVTAATKAQAAKALAGMSRKWAKRFGNAEVGAAEASIVEVDERMHLGLEAGGPATNRAVAKVLLSFYLLAGGARSAVPDLIEFVRSGKLGPPVNAGWYEGPPVHPAEGEAMLRHVVAVRGSVAEGRLLGYLELFGTLSFAAVLADPYGGPTVSRAHVLNLVDRRATELDAVEFAGYPWRVAGSASTTALKRGLTEVMRRANQLAAERRFERMWGAGIERAVRRAMETCAKGRSEIPMDELRPVLARELQPTIEAFVRDLVARRRQREARRAELNSADRMPTVEPSPVGDREPDGRS